MENLKVRHGHLSSYLECLNAADSESEPYQRKEAWFQDNSSGLKTLNAHFHTRIGESVETDFNALLKEPGLEAAEFMLQQRRKKAKFQMNDEAERLASDLNVNGINAWGRLHIRRAAAHQQRAFQPRLFRRAKTDASRL